jgi:hypothetical protein
MHEYSIRAQNDGENHIDSVKLIVDDKYDYPFGIIKPNTGKTISGPQKHQADVKIVLTWEDHEKKCMKDTLT